MRLRSPKNIYQLIIKRNICIYLHFYIILPSKQTKTMKRLFLTLTIVLTVAFANAQTADEIISKHIDAMGGKDKLSQLNSVYVESTSEVMGNQAPSKTTILNGKGFRLL